MTMSEARNQSSTIMLLLDWCRLAITLVVSCKNRKESKQPRSHFLDFIIGQTLAKLFLVNCSKFIFGFVGEHKEHTLHDLDRLAICGKFQLL